MGVIEDWACAAPELVVEGVAAEAADKRTKEPAMVEAVTAAAVGVETTTDVDEAVDVEVTAVGKGTTGRMGLVMDGISDEVTIVGEVAATTEEFKVSRARVVVINDWEAIDCPVISDCGSLPKTTSRADKGMSLRPGNGEEEVEDWAICHC